MRKVFFGTLIAVAQKELLHIPPLLSRASSQFLTEKSLDEAIKQLQKSQELLLKAKESYKNDFSIQYHHPQVIHHNTQCYKNTL